LNSLNSKPEYSHIDVEGTAVGDQVLRASARQERIGWIGLFAAFALMMLVNPSGFIGGGQDDWHYLHAARCLREHGFCLPHDHWEARWPVIGPIAFFTRILGESRFSVSIAPAIASLGALILLALVGNRLFRQPVGWIAALLLLVTPAFAVQLSQPSVEATELCFIFAGFRALLKWQERPILLWAFSAGLLFSLAIQVRETALVAAPFAFTYLCLRKPKPKLQDLLMALAGFALPFVVEFIWFAISVGDPFYRLKLSIHHTQIWSSELLGPIDRSHSPFFNKSYIANWRLQPGIHVYWPIDGLLNLFVNGIAGISIPFVTLLLLFGRRKLGAEVWRSMLILWLVAIGCAAVLIYAFAIDPKARMMLVPISLTSVALTLATLRLRNIGHPLISYSIWAAAAILGITLQFSHERGPMIESAARSWIAQYPDQIEIEPSARRFLALVPKAESLPPLNADKPFVIVASWIPCSLWLARSGYSPGTFAIIAHHPSVLVRARGELCLFRYKRPISERSLAGTIQRMRGGAKDERQFEGQSSLLLPARSGERLR
jgi:hypothetical protein